jgi:glycosyltransferase involved in cell wall biosynthesis
MRLAVVGIAPAPYRDGLFERLAGRGGVDLRVFYLHGEDTLRGWTGARLAYPAEFVPCWTPERGYSWPLAGAVNPALKGALNRFAADAVVIYGYSFWSQFAAAGWALRRGTPYLLRCDSNKDSLRRRRDGGAARWVSLKSRLVKRLARRSAGALTIGQSNREFWKRIGLPDEKLFFAPMAVDNERFGRAQAARPERRTLLYAGRFVVQKNLARLLQAWRLVEPERTTLLLAGDGPAKDDLQRAARGIERVEWGPFVPNEKMPELYRSAAGVILPSTFEPWGLVVNEAMAAGLPTLVSEQCGCAPDLAASGETGWTFDAGSVDSLAAALRAFDRADEATLDRYGRNALERIGGWSYEAAIGGFEQALEAVR